MQEDYTPRVASIMDTAKLDGTGRPVKSKRVTFYIGQHGPFFHDFEEGKDKPVDINGYIDATAAEVRAITGRNY